MAMHRPMFIIKAVSIICLAVVLGYGVYRFEAHVMTPSWTEFDERTEETKVINSAFTADTVHDVGFDGVFEKGDDETRKVSSILEDEHMNQSDQFTVRLYDRGSHSYHLYNEDGLYRKMVIVTAITEDQVNDALQMVASAQIFMPNTTIIMYSLAMSEKQYEELSKLCNVQMRHFKFETHPRHVRNLRIFAWRPIIIQETLQEFGVIFWADPNIRFKDSLHPLFPYLPHHHGTMLHIHSFDPKTPRKARHVYFDTNPRMYAYFDVSNRQYYKSNMTAPHIATGRMLLVNNSWVQEQILTPLTRYALDTKCISPRGSTNTNHRYDTSALAIIVPKHLPHEWSKRSDTTRYMDRVVDIRTSLKVKNEMKPELCK